MKNVMKVTNRTKQSSEESAFVMRNGLVRIVKDGVRVCVGVVLSLRKD